MFRNLVFRLKKVMNWFWRILFGKSPPAPVPDIPPDLGMWLTTQTKIRDALIWEAPTNGGKGSATVAYVNWTAQQKADLQKAFELAVSKGPYGTIVDPLPNVLHPPFNDYPDTILSEKDAWELYVSLVAQSLKTEHEQSVPWSLNDYAAAQLVDLLSSSSLFTWQTPVYKEDGDNIGDKITLVSGYEVNPWTIAAHGNIAMDFLEQQGLIGNTRQKTINQVLKWCGLNMVHYAGGPQTLTMMVVWHYRGLMPVSKVISGTVSDDDATKTLTHYVRGCAGTEDFLHHVLRVVNIPVEEIAMCGHAQVYFPSEGKYLAHGDDIYILKKHPELGGAAILIDQSTYTSWFGPQVSDMAKCDNLSNTEKKFP